MAEAPPPPPPQTAVVYKFHFSQTNESKGQRAAAKDRQLRARPDCLFEHDTKHGVICSLIFFTRLKDAWIPAILDFYPEAEIEEVTKGQRIKLGGTDGSIMVFRSGKFLILENCDLAKFKENFEEMKKVAVMRGIENMAVTATNDDNEEVEGNDREGEERGEEEEEEEEDEEEKEDGGRGGGLGPKNPNPDVDV